MDDQHYTYMVGHRDLIFSGLCCNFGLVLTKNMCRENFYTHYFPTGLTSNLKHSILFD